MITRWLFFCLVTLIPPACGGCAAEQKVDETERNLRRIVQAYNLCQRPPVPTPRSADDLIKRFPDLGETRPAEEVLRSPRDGEPFVIIYGQYLTVDGGNVILAYEKKGEDDKRYVVTLSQDIKILSDDEFTNAHFAGDQRPN